MPAAEVIHCTCGLVVLGAVDLDEVGLCVVCAGSGHDWGCGCIECAIYVERIDAGDPPAGALELVLAGGGRDGPA